MASEGTGSSQNMSSIIGLGKLPRYNGRTSVRIFIKTIKKRAKLEAWSDNQTAEIVKYLCTDLAEAYLDSHSELDDANFNTLCEHLNERFKPKITKTEAYSQLLAIRQDHLSVADYAGKIESCASELSEVLTELSEPDARDELLISVFLTGVSQNIKRMLISNEFGELVRAAKRCELTLPDSKRGGIHALNENGQNQSNRNVQYNARGGYQPRGRGSHSSRGGYRQHPNNRDKTCWNCGSPDHFRAYCDQPPINYRGEGYSKN